MVFRSAPRIAVAAALAVCAVTALAGCSTTSARSASASASASATPVGLPVGKRCGALLPARVLSVYGESFHRLVGAAATTKSGSTAATIEAQRGTVCEYRGSKGDTITLGVARLPAAASTRLKDTLYEHSNSVPTYSAGSTYIEGYFLKKSGAGRADAFPDPYWINTSSTLFTEPGAASPVIDAVRSVLVPASATATPSQAATPSAAPTG